MVSRIGSVPVAVPTAAKSTSASPSTAAKASTGYSSASSFTPAASSSSASSSSAASASGFSGEHVEASDSSVNEAVNQAIDDLAQDKSPDDFGEFAAETYCALGLTTFASAGCKAVMEKVRAYVKEHPDATMEEVKGQMYQEAVSQRGMLKYLEKRMAGAKERARKMFGEG